MAIGFFNLLQRLEKRKRQVESFGLARRLNRGYSN